MISMNFPAKLFWVFSISISAFIFLLATQNLKFDYFAFSRQVISSEYPALLREKKIFVSLSSTLDLQYLSLIPLSVLAWRQLGVESLLCLVGKDENFLKNVKTVLEHVLTKNVTITLIKDFTLPSTTIAQMCRVFAATSESLNLHDDSIVITSDIDYIPFHLENHWREGFELFFYNSNCCQSVEFKEISLKMYPISTIAMKRSIWGKVLPYSEKVYNDPSKMEKYLYSIFGEEAFMNEDYRKGILAQLQPQWLFDQILISYKIKEFLERGESPRSGHEVVVKKRIDRAFWPSPDELHKLNLSEHSDAHISQDLLKDWDRVRPLFERIFSRKHMMLTDFFIHELISKSVQ